MFKKVSAALIMASLLAAPAMAATTSGDALSEKSVAKTTEQGQLVAKKKKPKAKAAAKAAAVSVSAKIV